jgi:uncharacterized membrane protein
MISHLQNKAGLLFIVAILLFIAAGQWSDWQQEYKIYQAELSRNAFNEISK